ncbi:unnamed protein product [Moneuplotes crassus]|uniref:Uncharacterized protein n=1 Tax=Euplotes crassus TaxID=5936 RepID=A0AAD1UMV1_EUPCR|nr:unnamed protein product [Moneuplotes crassus]
MKVQIFSRNFGKKAKAHCAMNIQGGSTEYHSPCKNNKMKFSPLKSIKRKPKRELHQSHKIDLLKENKTLGSRHTSLNNSSDLKNAYREKSVELKRDSEKYLMYKSSFIPSVFVKKYTRSGLFQANKICTYKDKISKTYLRDKSCGGFYKSRPWQACLLEKLSSNSNLTKLKNMRTTDVELSPVRNFSFVHISNPVKEGSSEIMKFIQKRAELQNKLKGRNQILSNSLKVRKINNKKIQFQNDIIKKKTRTNNFSSQKRLKDGIFSPPLRRKYKFTSSQRTLKTKTKTNFGLQMKDIGPSAWETSNWDDDETFYDYNDLKK